MKRLMHKKLAIIVALIIESVVIMRAYGATVSTHYHPCLACDPENNHFIVMYTSNWFGLENFVFGQFINAEGTPSELIIRPIDDYSASPAIAYDNINKNSLVVSMTGLGDTGTAIVGQFISADGSVNGNNFIISDANMNLDFPVGRYVILDRDFPAVSFDTANQRFLVAWADGISGDATGTDIVGQFISADGTQNGNSFVITDGTGYEPRRLAVAYNPNADNFLVSFDGKTDCDGVNIVSCIGYAIIEDSDSGSTSDGGGCFITNAASR